MAKSSSEFPKPAKPLSFKQVVDKILEEPDYAEFIHNEVLKARDGDTEAGKKVAAHFKPLPDELKRLKLPPDFGDDDRCTNNTTHYLIDFAAPAKLW
ncbi:MAG: hypothetical protein H0U99_02205 [Chthoniobacterales bacterium]|nr:hypothetical protein [Chthoniobacterales bacterium]